jgi:serine/threonine protein kinase
MSGWSSSLKQSHSGDELTAFSAGSSNYIKKSFKSKNQRILDSIRKQQSFEKITTGLINVSSVDVIEITEENESLTILMPYIDGLSGSEYALYGDREIGSALSSSMNQLIIMELMNSNGQNIDKIIFKQKISEIELKIRNKELTKLAKKIQSDLSSLPDFINIPIGTCHGDLTLSNIICSRYQGIKLIDFLSVYLESPLQDVSKIIQDYQYGWSFRYLSTPEKIKGAIFLKNEMPDIIGIVSEKYKSQIALLTRLTLLRIAPYLKDTITENWLMDALKNYIEITDERS